MFVVMITTITISVIDGIEALHSRRLEKFGRFLLHRISYYSKAGNSTGRKSYTTLELCCIIHRLSGFSNIKLRIDPEMGKYVLKLYFDTYKAVCVNNTTFLTLYNALLNVCNDL